MIIIINGKKKKKFRSQKYENSIYTKKKVKLFCIHSIVSLIVMPTVKSLDPFT